MSCSTHRRKRTKVGGFARVGCTSRSRAPFGSATFEVNMALRTLTFLFIGGASSTSRLLSCQSVDGGGEEIGEIGWGGNQLPDMDA